MIRGRQTGNHVSPDVEPGLGGPGTPAESDGKIKRSTASPMCTQKSCVAGSVGAIVFLALFCLVRTYVYSYKYIPATAAGDCSALGWQHREVPVRVYDTFSFNSEFDVLEARLHELYDVVDGFVLVEATQAFSGKQKPLMFDLNKTDPRWAPFLPKIEHVKLQDDFFADLPPGKAEQAVERKRLTKSGLVLGLDRLGAEGADLVVFSDLDEIPRADVVKSLAKCTGYNMPVSIHTPNYLYDLGCYFPGFWERVRVVRRDQLQLECSWLSFVSAFTGSACPDDVRSPQGTRLGGLTLTGPTAIGDGGWHMSYFMSFDKMVEKLESISHIERNTESNKRREHLQCLVCQCRHVAGEQGIRADVTSATVGPSWIRQAWSEGRAPYKDWFPSQADVCATADLSQC